MRIHSLRLENFRSFVDTGQIEIELGQINVFIGPNNAGKSSLLKAAHYMQEGCQASNADLRLDATGGRITLELQGLSKTRAWAGPGADDRGTLRVEVGGNSHLRLQADQSTRNVGRLPSREPNHAIVPYLSRRKVSGYQEDVSEQSTLAISASFEHLAAKLSRLGNPDFPMCQQYRQTCERVLGFVVTAVPSAKGQRPGVYLEDGRTMPIDQMGEGVPNIVGLLADLALSKDKIMLIEEPENDLHPGALKALLELIEQSASSNQFLISTHSNIVARHLGAADDSRLFRVDSEPGTLPTVATVRAVERTPQARVKVLRELGYSFSDFDLWDGWLILEEASAERIIRDYLIPWFAPKLSRLRTMSAGGNSQVEPTFVDFDRLVRFTHLEEVYRDAAWVRLDGDEDGRRIAEQLRDRYRNWTPDRFGTFTEPQFERYYPDAFDNEVDEALSTSGKQARRDAKRQLLDRLRAWLDEDEVRGRSALEQSAADVIAELRTIEAQLVSSTTP